MTIKQHIPNFLTICNLICGCAAIFMSFQFRFLDAVLLILVAAIFDFFDGMVARLLKVNSEIGKELDSMADMISFGVTPFFLVFLFLFELSGELSIQELILNHFWVVLLALTPALSAVRLAKFNLDTQQNDGFIGLNTPTNTLFLVSLPFICLKFQLDFYQSAMVIIPLASVSSLLLNAKIPMLNLKFKNLAFKENFLRFVLIGVSVLTFIFCLLIDFIALCFPIIILLYILISLIEQNKKHEI